MDDEKKGLRAPKEDKKQQMKWRMIHAICFTLLFVGLVAGIAALLHFTL